MKKLLELIQILEELNWQYAITYDDRFRIILGNTEYDIDKHDEEELQKIIDVIEHW